MTCNGNSMQYLWSIWVKAPCLRNRKLYIVSACLPSVNAELFKKLCNEGTVLLACPERESAAYYGKIASIIKSSNPTEIVVLTIDGSPHCFALQASLNEAEYILGYKLNKRHYVLVDGKDIKEISPNAIRVARYLHIVDELIKENDEVLKHLERHSLEYLHVKE